MPYTLVRGQGMTRGDADDAALRFATFELGGARFAVLSRPLPSRPSELTEAEWQVARMAAAGLSNQQIAAERGRSVATVANQVSHVLAKLGLERRSQLAARLIFTGKD